MEPIRSAKAIKIEVRKMIKIRNVRVAQRVRRAAVRRIRNHHRHHAKMSDEAVRNDLEPVK
jgi:hypothetical protein